MNNTGDDANASIETDQCSLSAEEIANSYNLKLRIVSVFVLLVVSLLGASISVTSARSKRFHINPIIINTGKFFGSGVILATAFIHILPEAMGTLSDSCLPESWNAYEAYGGLFAMLAILGMQLIEFLAHQYFRSHSVGHSHVTVHKEVHRSTTKDNINGDTKDSIDLKRMDNPTNDVTITGHGHQNHHNEHSKKNKKKMRNAVFDIENTKQINQQNLNSEELSNTDNMITRSPKSVQSNNHEQSFKNVNDTYSPPRKSKDKADDVVIKVQEINSMSPSVNRYEEFNNGTTIIEPPIHCHDVVFEPELNCQNADYQLNAPCSETVLETSTHCHGVVFEEDGHEHKISAYLLEFGIAIHSVLIGLTLGTTTDSFVALFIALCFHQFFEAIALGAQIARAKTISIKSAALMVVLFTLTTPVGIAIGIGVHSGVYNPKSVASLLVTGILDSLSGGILVYVALVNLITADMGVHAHDFHTLSTKLKFLYYIALYLGAAIMAIIGRWA